MLCLSFILDRLSTDAVSQSPQEKQMTSMSLFITSKEQPETQSILDGFPIERTVRPNTPKGPKPIVCYRSPS